MIVMSSPLNGGVWYPEAKPNDKGNCFNCDTDLASAGKARKSKHLLLYARQKRIAHLITEHYIPNDLTIPDRQYFCYSCAGYIDNKIIWEAHSYSHLENLRLFYGVITIYSIVIQAGTWSSCEAISSVSMGRDEGEVWRGSVFTKGSRVHITTDGCAENPIR
ncbi:hypothetical protein M501DRAFT_462682 [Patellaria atrata CBS 101060]|uniref:Uncharacterized protein n=1 Tax=Patellaria atrata CBS 101060 TaxID=1346257 RepID=A0A9P4S360_9PEZI|nr:hypothetical protein M501DRAFT_462682 [Patellaria atrata CBS 101060]